MMRNRKVFFVNGWVDGFFMGGVTILMLLITRFIPAASSASFMMAAYYFSWFVNWPHFSATSYRFYQSKSNLRQFPVTAFVIPFVLFGAIFFILASPEVIAPYYMKLFSLWSPYHFAAQTLGLTLIYAKRTQFQIGKWERLSLSGFIMGIYLTQASRQEVGVGYQEILGIKFPLLGLPSWMPEAARVYMYASLFLFAILAIRQGLKTKRWIQWPVLLPGFAQFIWFSNVDFQTFQAFIPFFHSLQYLLIAWSMQMGVSKSRFVLDKNAKGEFATHGWRHFLWPSVKWCIVVGGGGAFLFLGFPALLEAMNWPYHYANAITITAVQFHHFFVDGVIWKLRGQSTGSLLMSNVMDPV